MKTLRIFRLLQRGGGAGSATAALPVVAFAVVTALLLIVLGGVRAFFSWTDDSAPTYQLLSAIAVALLVVPLITLGGSAARLSARRRDDRLSTLRLLGASARLVTTLTVIESTIFAVVGALLGVLGYASVVPLVGMIPFRGSPLGGSLWLAPWVIGLVVVAVAILAAASAITGLRGVIVTPLGVRTRQTAPRMHSVRVLIGVGVIVLAFLGFELMGTFGGILVIGIVLAGGFGGALAVLNLVGPWVLRKLATRQARLAQTAARLLAARSILESPAAAWRQVSGVAMTSFMAVVAGVGVALLSAAGSGSDPEGELLTTDIGTGVIITLVASFLVVGCSVGVNQAAAILDRRDLYVSLDRLGMPMKTMDAARSRAVMSPLRIVAIGSALIAAVVIFPLAGIALIIAPASLVVIAGCLAGGIALVWVGLRSTRPVLARVLTQPDRVA